MRSFIASWHSHWWSARRFRARDNPAVRVFACRHQPERIGVCYRIGAGICIQIDATREPDRILRQEAPDLSNLL